jgi:hypothetical protein
MRGQISSLIVIVLSIAILVLGILLIQNISKVTAALPSPKAYFFTSSVFPEKGQLGTVFTITISVGETNRSDIYRIDAIISKDKLNVATIPMFDDGLHGDSKSNDGIYANTFDSSGKEEGVYIVDVEINPVENAEKYKEAASFQIFKKNCINLKYSGNPSEKVDVVFLASNYKDMEKFRSDVIKYLDFNGNNKGLFALEPFKSNTDKFNIYLVNQTDDLGCSLNCQGIRSMICCNDNKVSEAALQCPSDQIIVLNDLNQFCGTASYYAKVCTISRGQEVLTHEFGHSFGGFGDEYEYSNYYPGYNPGEYNYPNCDQEGCPKWSNLELQGIGCFKGCGISTQYKSTNCNCIMCGYVGHYDPVDVIYLRKLLDNYSPLRTGGELAPPIEKSYAVNLNLNRGQLSLNNVYVTETISPDRKISLASRIYYKAKLISFDGTELDSIRFDMANTEYPFFDYNNDSSRPSPIVYPSVDRLVSVPYYKNAQKMEVYDSVNRKVLEIDLTRFSSQCGDGKCEVNENYVQCPADCSQERKDNVCVYSEDGVCDPDCQKIDPDCKKITPLMTANIIAFAALVLLMIFLFLKRK